MAEEDALNGACPTEEKSDCLEGGPTMNSKLKELISHEGIIFWSTNSFYIINQST